MRVVTRQMAEKAAELMGLALDDPEFCETAVQRQFREKAKAAHPDGGGDAHQFVELDKAKCILVSWLARPVVKVAVDPAIASTRCPVCKGAGRRTIGRGFRTMTMVCGTCRGLGELVRPDKVEE